MLRNVISLDFEFNEITSEQVNLVCCTTHIVTKGIVETFEWWLHNESSAKEALTKYLLDRAKSHIVFGYSCVAEGRSFLALGLNPSDFKWIDGFVEYRVLTNHNDDLMYGQQLVEGKVITVSKPPPKWERTEEDGKGFKPKHSLAEATYKLTGVIRDTEHKNKMRDLIISAPESFTPQERADIQAYCTEDVVFLPEILSKIVENFNILGFDLNQTLVDEMILRGRYTGALTAKMESLGYPIDYNSTKNFSSAVGPLLEECQREINALFPEIKPFRYNSKERRFSWNQAVTKLWLKHNADIKYWTKTDGLKKAKKFAIQRAADKLLETTKRKITHAEKEKVLAPIDESEYLSLSLEAWEKQFAFRHSYPKDNFGAQMVRYLKLKQSLNGFVPNANGSFWDAVGPDERVRCYFNPFGSLSGRSQPGSRSFLFLKPAFMRALCVPKKGKAICGIDYGSQEFLISALVAEDDEMVAAYASGDVYLAFAIAAGMCPKTATKETHKAVRNLAKATTLGISYLMTKTGLAAKLTADSGKVVTEDDAQDLIDSFYEVYSDLGNWQQKVQRQYAEEGYLKLPCGWTLFGNNDNFRSVVNFGIQGFGASIMRKAVDLCDQAGIKVIVTLHDALYIEYDSDDYGAVDTLRDCMKKAFIHYFDESQKKDAAKIKMDAFCWSPDYDDPTITIDSNGRKSKTYASITTPAGLEVEVSATYVDERSEDEYNQFSKYFTDREENSL